MTSTGFLHGKWPCFILLLISENFFLSVTPLAELESEVGLNLQCYNDYDETIVCQFRPPPDWPNCTDYSLTGSSPLSSSSSSSKKKRECCNCKDSEGFLGECSCSIRMRLIQDSYVTVTLWRAGKKLESKDISITQSIKPKPPTITSVEETANGDVRVMWNCNYEKTYFKSTLTYDVSYRKTEGKTEGSSIISAPTHQHDIYGGDLESSTEYVVSVRSCTDLNDKCSDSSGRTFQTSLSFHVILWTVIGVLCFTAVVVTSVAFVSCVKVKSTFWDKAARCPNPALLGMIPGEQTLLQPQEIMFCPVTIDPLKKHPNEDNPWSKCLLLDTSSGESSQWSNDSSSLGYGVANTVGIDVDVHKAAQEAMREAFPHLAPTVSSPDNAVARSNGDSRLVTSDYDPCSSSGSSCFSNRSYSIRLPTDQKTMTSGDSEFPMKAGVLSCEPAYRSTEGDVLSNKTTSDPPAPVCRVTAGPPDIDWSPVASPRMQTDFSYQPCDADAGNGSSAEGSGSCPIFNDIIAPVSCTVVASGDAGYESFNEAVRGSRDVLPEGIPDVNNKETLICDMNPCYESLPAPLSNISPTSDDYQAFQSVVKQPDVFPGQNNIEDEFFSRIPQSSFGTTLVSNAQVGQCFPELGGPFLSALSTDQSEPIVTDGCYHSV